MADTSPAIAKLQSEWQSLPDLDRAGAVFAIHRAGTSLRQLAKALSCSLSILRHLLEALQAPPEDRHLACQGKISTNELVRRGRAAGIGRATKQHEALELERAEASLKGCKAICQWLAAEGISGSSGAQIVDEARRLLVIAGESEQLPRDAAPPGMPTAMIIQRCRPAEPKTDAISFVAWFAFWLALWTAYSITDSAVRYQAIELALDRQLRR
jgi:hypothetical protein